MGCLVSMSPSKMPKVSVLMAVYNQKDKWFDEAVKSVLNQTYDNIELIIVDDGSSRLKANHIDYIAKKDGRISVIHHVENV